MYSVSLLFLLINYNRRLKNLARMVLFMFGQLQQTVKLCSDEASQNLVQWCGYLNCSFTKYRYNVCACACVQI